MIDLLAARSQMAMSLGFHIIFAMVGVAMPVLMVVAERRWQRTGDQPFSLEGFAFFLGVHLYGWERISPRAHLAAASPRITLVLALGPS